jgi:hypothetical protein
VLLAGLCLGAWTAYPIELLGLFIGPVLVGAALTLRERAMLGDAGANLVGALAGVSLLVTKEDGTRHVGVAERDAPPDRKSALSLLYIHPNSLSALSVYESSRQHQSS